MANEEVVVTTDTQDLLGLSADAADVILSNCQVQIQLVDTAPAAQAVQADDNSKQAGTGSVSVMALGFRRSLRCLATTPRIPRKPAMTDAEWKKEAARLKGAATRAKSKVKKVTMLADKIEAREAQKAAEEALRMHKLNYYELVAIQHGRSGVIVCPPPPAISSPEIGSTSMEMKFRTQSGATVTADPMAEAPHPVELADPAAERGVGHVESASLLRKQIERVIREYGADPAEAALAVCVILDGNLGLAEDGWFDDDETVLNAIIAGSQADD